MSTFKEFFLHFIVAPKITIVDWFNHYILDPDLVRARQEAMDASRQRLQEQHNEEAKLYAEKLKEVCNNSCKKHIFIYEYFCQSLQYAIYCIWMFQKTDLPATIFATVILSYL
jgi:hypothetical protein